MLSRINSAITVGLNAIPIQIEVDVANRGLPSFTIVGLPDKAVQESRERVRAALHNSGINMPAKRIIVNLAPADIPKQGPLFDLPIALGILIANQDIDVDISDQMCIGEVSLDGTVRPIRGALLIAQLARQQKCQSLYLPFDNHQEAAIIDQISIYPIKSISQLVLHLTNQEPLTPIKPKSVASILKHSISDVDMKHIYGQESAKHALEIAAAGGHNLLFTGTPGAGKTLLSKACAGILPRLTPAEAIEITQIYSVSQAAESYQIITRRPYRNPHHTTSKVGLIGGGPQARPGEISLAHRGVLFLDEFPEFPKNVIESLRQPMEDGVVTITRASHTAKYPAKFMLIAASNPCPCGYLGHPTKACHCTQAQISRYQKKISGPMLDRIDLSVAVPAVEINKLSQSNQASESSAQVRRRVQQARDTQTNRYQHAKYVTNADLTSRGIKKFCPLQPKTQSFLLKAAEKLDLSARAYFKVIKVARTIADLTQEPDITPSHIASAIQYRQIH